MSTDSPEPEPPNPGSAPPTGNPTAATPPTGAPDPKRYEEITNLRFATAAASFEALPTRGGVILRGTCPRCADPMEFPHVDRVYRMTLPGRSTAARRSGAEQDVVHMICTCTADHPGRPEGLDGCGAYWNVRLGPEQP
ncbi:hypothetical protein GCM10010440_36740 [Kitasatospora cinereorecta]